MRISKSIKEAIQNGLADANIFMTKPYMDEVLQCVHFHIKDVLAQKSLPWAAGNNDEVAKAVQELFNELFPKE